MPWGAATRRAAMAGVHPECRGRASSSLVVGCRGLAEAMLAQPMLDYGKLPCIIDVKSIALDQRALFATQPAKWKRASGRPFQASFRPDDLNTEVGKIDVA